MADSEEEFYTDEVPEIPVNLERVLLFALDEAREKLADGGEVVPFTAVELGDNIIVETYPGENAQECLDQARAAIQGMTGIDCYALCYDGYVETEDGDIDALISEGGMLGDETGHAVGYLYEISGDEGDMYIEEDPAYIGAAPNFLA